MQNFNWKACIWSVKTSPKIQHFLWKASSKALPVGSLLESRGISVSPGCKRCGARETELHVLLQCPYAERVWELVPCLHKPSPTGITSVAALLQHCRKLISLPPIGLGSVPLYPWILWTLWTNRNKLLFENKFFSEESSVLKALKDARAWQNAQAQLTKSPLPHRVVPCRVVSCTNSYTWSVCSDAAWNPSTGSCGLGWRLCDASGVCAESSSSHRRDVPSALVAEALAVKAAMGAAVSSHVRSLMVYSDSKALILLLNSQAQDVVLKGVLHDISVMAGSFSSISFNFIPRLENVSADALAKAALYSLQLP